MPWRNVLQGLGQASQVRAWWKVCPVLTRPGLDFQSYASLATAEQPSEYEDFQSFPEQADLEGSYAVSWRNLPRDRVLRSPEIYQRRMQELGDLNR